MPPTLTPNTLFYGDNLPILRDYIPTESIDLIYLDPPFNSSRSYNILFRDESGKASEAQITAFDDTWHWGEAAEATYTDLVTQYPGQIATMISALRQFIGANQMMAYLVMMAARLVELHRILKPTGSLYLHCDPTASHYLKIILDTVFRGENFRNEVVWQRTATKGDARQKFGAVHDAILLYSKTESAPFKPVFLETDDAYISRFRYDDDDGKGPYRLAPLDSPNPRPNLTYEYKGYQPPAKGWRVSRQVMEQLDRDGRLYFPKDQQGRIARKHYLHEQLGRKASDVWTDIPPLQASAAERLGYPTQKPLALLERIIEASSNPGDIVLDPFCGCGTAIAAAEKLNRRWVGIDVTHLAISLIKYRMKDMFPDSHYQVIGEPQDLAAAHQLAQDDRFQFQWWALSLVGAKPVGADPGSKTGKKGKDQGIDGLINFIDGPKGQPQSIIVQVKSGKVKSGDIRDLRGVLQREKAPIGLFITLGPSTKDMDTEAVTAGYYASPLWQRDYPRLQIITIEDLLTGRQPNLPPTHGTFAKAPRAKKTEGTQGALDL